MDGGGGVYKPVRGRDVIFRDDEVGPLLITDHSSSQVSSLYQEMATTCVRSAGQCDRGQQHSEKN